MYRCALVHEFREPGYDIGNLGDDPTPRICDTRGTVGRVRRGLVLEERRGPR